MFRYAKRDDYYGIAIHLELHQSMLMTNQIDYLKITILAMYG